MRVLDWNIIKLKEERSRIKIVCENAWNFLLIWQRRKLFFNFFRDYECIRIRVFGCWIMMTMREKLAIVKVKNSYQISKWFLLKFLRIFIEFQESLSEKSFHKSAPSSAFLIETPSLSVPPTFQDIQLLSNIKLNNFYQTGHAALSNAEQNKTFSITPSKRRPNAMLSLTQNCTKSFVVQRFHESDVFEESLFEFELKFFYCWLLFWADFWGSFVEVVQRTYVIVV